MSKETHCAMKQLSTFFVTVLLFCFSDFSNAPFSFSGHSDLEAITHIFGIRYQGNPHSGIPGAEIRSARFENGAGFEIDAPFGAFKGTSMSVGS